MVIFGINITSADISKLLYVISGAVRRVKFETILKFSFPWWSAIMECCHLQDSACIVIIVCKNTKSGAGVVLITNYERRKSKISSNERNKIYLEEQGEFVVTLVLD